MEVNEEALDKAKSKLEGVQERLHLKDQSVVVVALLLRISATLLTITSKLEGVQERLHLKDQSVVVVALLLRISATLLTITSKKLLHNTLHI